MRDQRGGPAGDGPAALVADGSFVEVEPEAALPATPSPSAVDVEAAGERRGRAGSGRTALAVVQPAPLLPDAAEWRTMMGMADALFRSGLLPGHVRSPQAALAVMQKGRELQVPPMYALTNIVVIQGKPTANAELMLALIYRDHGDDAIRVEATTTEGCTIAYRRRGWAESQRYTFTIEDAHRAGLASGANPAWLKYPQAMLRARAISAVARMAFPDSIAGMYTPEEMGARVHLADDGEMVYTVPDEPPHRPRGRAAASGPRPHPARATSPAPNDSETAASSGGVAAGGRSGLAPAAASAGPDSTGGETEPTPYLTPAETAALGEPVGGLRLDFVAPRGDPLACMAVLDGGRRCGAVLAGTVDRASGRATPPDELLRRMRAKGVPAGAVLCLKHAADYVRAVSHDRDAANSA